MVDKAVSVATGYLQAIANGSASQYANLTPPQIITAQPVDVPAYADIKQQELNRSIPAGTPTTTFNSNLNPINSAAQWAQKFPTPGTVGQPKVVTVTNGGLNIPTGVNLSNYVIIVDNGSINFNGSSTLNNVVLVANNGNINLNTVQANNVSVLASGTVNHNSSARFGGISLIANGTGDIIFNGATQGITSNDNLRVISANNLTFNGSQKVRGSFLSKGNFIANGSSEIYGTVSSNRQEWLYDNAQNQIGSRSYVGSNTVVSINTYDAAGRKVSSTDPLGHTTRYVYDRLGRLIETRYADGLTSKTTYDAVGNEIVKIDRANRQTKYEFDAIQNLIAVIDPVYSRTTYNYNELGSLVSETDANGHQTKYEYDGLQRRTAVIRPLGQRQTTIYDKIGNAVSMTDFNGQTTNYTYGLGNLLIGKQLADGSQTSIAYTNTGQRQSVTDSRGITTYGYNPQGQMTTVSNPDSQQISYGYDSQGHLTSVTTATGTTTYTYGALNRLQEVTDAQGGITAYTYNDLGNLVSTKFANGITETRGYDTLNRLISVTNTNALSQVISSYVYTLDAVGNKLQVLENNGRRVDYTYDNRDRLLSEKITNPVAGIRTIAYTYDAVGNRLSVSDSVAGATTYTYNDNDWLVATVSGGEQTQYTYDNNGSLLSKFRNINDQQTFTWNLDHKLSEVQITNSSGTHQSTYWYDADGNRIAQNVDGVNTNYLVDTNRGLDQVALEYGSEGVRTSYTYAGGVISQTSNNVQTFYINDGHSGVRFTASINGSITDAYNYDGYGNLLSGSVAAGGDRYRGESRDSRTGLQYLRARYYDASSGRFLSTDPFEGFLNSPISRHRYLYANNNPITYSDPTGNFAISMAEVNTALSIMEVLTIATAVQSGIGEIARFSGNIEWNGKLSSIGAKGEFLGIDVNAGLSFLDLTTKTEERSPYLYPEIKKGKFRGTWLQILGGAGISVPDIFKQISPNTLSFNSSVEASSPRIFQATPVAFAGTYIIASLTAGSSSPKYFRAGFGSGGSPGLPSETAVNKIDAGISLKEGISIPISFFPAIE